MVGDRCFDIDAAKGAGVLSIGIINGADTENELKEHNADFIVSDAYEMKKLFEEKFV